MLRTGNANLPLHGGKAPSWLTGRMRLIAREIANIMIDRYGTTKFIERLSDPFWFQAFGCALAYDWHSSGVTTVVTGVLKTALSAKDHGLCVCGGKGRTSRKTPSEIQAVGEEFNFSQQTIDKLTYTSRMTAKVDNAAIQAGYQLYHHTFLITKEKRWAVIQQGMNDYERSARRFHWLSANNKSFVNEPHNAVVGIKHDKVLNMVASKSEASRKASVDLAKEPTRKLFSLIQSSAKPSNQISLANWLNKTENRNQQAEDSLTMSRNIKWDTLERIYNFQPQNYEELLAVKGVGPATVRGLALLAELMYGEEPSWDDPVKFSFAYGGKDDVPYPVNRKAMDESIQILRNSLEAARLGEKDKLNSLENLRRFVPENKNF
jgi:uncharacterized protein